MKNILRENRYFKYFIGLVISLAICYPTVHEILKPGFFPMHDDTQVARVFVMGSALKNGQFPVRWVSGLGYGFGYPIFNFYGPLPYYFGGLLDAFGIDSLTSTKMMFIFAQVISVGSMYTFVYFVAGTLPAVVGTTLYTYTPYRAVDMYVRGAVGEYWLMGWLPLILLGWYLIATKRESWGILVGSFAVALSVLSHTLLGYVTVGLYLCSIAANWIIQITEKRQDQASLRAHLHILIYGLGLSAFFWIPAFIEKGYSNVASQVSSTADYRDHFICLRQLWYSPWGFGGSAPGCIDGLSFGLGRVYIVLAVIAGVLVIFLRNNPLRKLLLIGMVGVFGSLFLTTKYSIGLWSIIPNSSYLQYPWRFLVFTVFFLSVVGALTVSWLPKKAQIVMSTVVVIIVVLQYYGLYRPQFTYDIDAASLTSREAIEVVASRISDEYLPERFYRPQQEGIEHDTIILTDDLDAQIVVNTEIYKKFIFRLDHDANVRFQHVDFPGWKYLVNGQEVQNISNEAAVTLLIPSGGSTVEFKLVGTIIRKIANIISIIALCFFIYFYAKKNNA